MVFRFFGSKGGEHLESIETKVQEMLAYDRHEIELAFSALLGDVVAKDVNDELRSTDRKVNRLEREIRRDLIVHTSVFGGIESPTVLIYMSIVKDIERIGDYAKNMLDLGLDGASFRDLDDVEDWRALSRDIANYITDAGTAFRSRNAETTRILLRQGDDLLSYFDERVTALVRGDDQGAQAVPRALAYRYLKRVVAHLMNMLTSVVMPLDRLDSFDEDPEDRDLGA